MESDRASKSARESIREKFFSLVLVTREVHSVDVEIHGREVGIRFDLARHTA